MTLHLPKVHPSICHLPEELIDEIVYQVYIDSGRFVRSVVPLSLTCWQLRKATLPVIFHSITLSGCGQTADQRTLDFLCYLAQNPNISGYIRHVRAFPHVLAHMDEKLQVLIRPEVSEHALALTAFRNLSSLKKVR